MRDCEYFMWSNVWLIQRLRPTTAKETSTYQFYSLHFIWLLYVWLLSFCISVLVYDLREDGPTLPFNHPTDMDHHFYLLGPLRPYHLFVLFLIPVYMHLILPVSIYTLFHTFPFPIHTPYFSLPTLNILFVLGTSFLINQQLSWAGFSVLSILLLDIKTYKSSLLYTVTP